MEKEIRGTNELDGELGEEVDVPVAVCELYADLPLGYTQGFMCRIQQLQRYGVSCIYLGVVFIF